MGFIIDRQKLLAGHHSHRIQSRSGASCQYNSFLLPYMPPWRLSGAALFAQLICPRRFLFPPFCFSLLFIPGLSAGPYSLGLFCPAGFSFPPFFCHIHWPALGRPYSPVYSATAGFSFPSASLSHPIGQPSAGGLIRQFIPPAGSSFPPAFCHIPLASPRQATASSPVISSQRQDSYPPTLASYLPGEIPGGKDNFLSRTLSG